MRLRTSFLVAAAFFAGARHSAARCEAIVGARLPRSTAMTPEVVLDDPRHVMEPEERLHYQWFLNDALADAAGEVQAARGTRPVLPPSVLARIVDQGDSFLVTFYARDDLGHAKVLGGGDAFGRDDLQRAACVAAAVAVGLPAPGVGPTPVEGRGYVGAAGLAPALRSFTGIVEAAAVDARASRFRGLMQLSLGTTHAYAFAGGVQLSLWENAARGRFFGVAQVSLRQNGAGTFGGLLQLTLGLNIANSGFAFARVGGMNGNGMGTETADASMDRAVFLLDAALLNLSYMRPLEGIAIAAMNWSHSGARVGVQVGGYNKADYSIDAGMQVGVYNSVGHAFRGGVQIGIANVVGRGPRLILASSQSLWDGPLPDDWDVRSFHGALQVGLYNDVLLDFAGLELGGVNRVGVLRGAQLGGVVNAVRDAAYGLQLAAVNVAHEVGGVQIGVVNVAGRLRGIQVGVVNVAAHGGLPVSVGLNVGW